MLGKRLCGFDSVPNITHIDPVASIAPQPTIMEVESASKMDWLCSRELLKTDFERTFDRNGQNIWQSSWTGKIPVLPIFSMS